VILGVSVVTAVIAYRVINAPRELGDFRPGHVKCAINMKGISQAMIVYANDDPNGKLPPGDKWCDLLVGLDYTYPKQFICVSSDAIEPGESSYAVNKNLVGKNLSQVSGDVVLLFETDHGVDSNGRNETLENRACYKTIGYGNPKTKVYKDRWNQSGGAEILTTEHHKVKGCNVVFVNLQIKFVETENLGQLRWK
jgi:hypothetical protein